MPVSEDSVIDGGNGVSDIKDIESQSAKDKFYEGDAGDGTKVYEQYLTGIPLYMCFGSLFITLFLIGLDQTIVITILETVGNKFNAYDNIGWVASGYFLTMSMFAQTWGRVSIVFGRKNSILVAILLFEAGSLMCALASSMNILIGGRVLAGIGGGGIQTLAFIIGSELVPIDKRSMVFAMFGLSFAFSSVAGPLIGGAFTENVSWRWCFYVNLPIGGLAAVALTFFFKPVNPRGTWKERLSKFDYIGTFLLSSGTVIFLLALTFGGVQYPWRSAAVIVNFILGGLLFIVFGVWNFKFSKYPIIPYEIVAIPQVDFPVLSLFTAFFYFMGMTVYISTYYQVIQGKNALETGVHLLPTVLALVFSNVSTGLLIKNTRYIKPFSVLGGICGCVGFGVLTLLDVDSSSSAKIGLMILPGIALGSILQTGIMAAQLNAPKIEGGTILTTALFNFSRSLGGAVGSTLSQAIFNSSYKNKITEAVKSNPDYFKNIDLKIFSQFLSSPSSISNIDPSLKKIILECIMKSIRNVFYTSTGASCLTFVFILFFSNKRVPKSEDVKQKEDYEKTEKALQENVNDEKISPE